MTEVEVFILGIINAIGIDRLLRLIAGTTDRDYINAILDSEYEAVRQVADAAANAKFGKP